MFSRRERCCLGTYAPTHVKHRSTLGTRNRRMSLHAGPPMPLGAHANTNARAPNNRAHRHTAILEKQAIAFEIQPVLVQ